jgi:hypothetical protein
LKALKRDSRVATSGEQTLGQYDGTSVGHDLFAHCCVGVATAKKGRDAATAAKTCEKRIVMSVVDCQKGMDAEHKS